MPLEKCKNLLKNIIKNEMNENSSGCFEQLLLEPVEHDTSRGDDVETVDFIPKRDVDSLPEVAVTVLVRRTANSLSFSADNYDTLRDSRPQREVRVCGGRQRNMLVSFTQLLVQIGDVSLHFLHRLLHVITFLGGLRLKLVYQLLLLAVFIGFGLTVHQVSQQDLRILGEMIGHLVPAHVLHNGHEEMRPGSSAYNFRVPDIHATFRHQNTSHASRSRAPDDGS